MSKETILPFSDHLCSGLCVFKCSGAQLLFPETPLQFIEESAVDILQMVHKEKRCIFKRFCFSACVYVCLCEYLCVCVKCKQYRRRRRAFDACVEIKLNV